MCSYFLETIGQEVNRSKCYLENVFWKLCDVAVIVADEADDSALLLLALAPADVTSVEAGTCK